MYHQVINQITLPTTLPTLRKQTKSLILTLGQCSLPTGQPHPWLLQRAQKTYDLLLSQNLCPSTTSIIVSGTDLSTSFYNIKNKKHKSQAYHMKKALKDIHIERMGKGGMMIDVDVGWFDGENVVMDQNAATTVQNFYFGFRILVLAGVQLTKMYVVTSDFHMSRSMFVCRTFFFKGNRQLVGTADTFDFNSQVVFVESETKWWENEKEKQQKFEKEKRLVTKQLLVQDAEETSLRLWQELNKLE